MSPATEQPAAGGAYLAALARLIEAHGPPGPCIVIDRGRLQHNIDQVRTHLPAGCAPRIVTKSLPCAALLDMVMAGTATDRLMAFHGPWLAMLHNRWPQADLLLGKPLPTDELVAFFAPLQADAARAAARRVQWLVDTPERLAEYCRFADGAGLHLRLNIEIDIGLGRGGVPDPAALGPMLEELARHPAQQFAGFMGYDAHVPHLPDPDAAFETAMRRYAEFVTAASAARGRLPASKQAWVCNSGGSTTWPRYVGAAPVNDVAIGSAFLRPARFGELADHQPALFIATPVLKRFPRAYPSRRRPELDTSVVLYGGGWPAELRWPTGLHSSAGSDAPGENLLPNQSLYFANNVTAPAVGARVLFEPQQGDALFQFENITVVQAGQIVDTWQPLPRRY